MKADYRILDRMDPELLDLSDPDQKALLELFVQRYRFAALYAEGKRVLDLPCSVGFGCEILRKEGKAAAVVGCEFDPEHLEKAKKLYNLEGIEYAVADEDKLELPGKFDLITSLDSLAHILSPPRFLRRLGALLTPGGEIIVAAQTTPTSDFNPGHVHDFTQRSFLRTIRKGGFTLVGQLFQIQRFTARSAYLNMKKKRLWSDPETGDRSLLLYYLSHPVRGLRRGKSLMLDGLTIKTLIVRARPNN
jgi:cyclopropane fatty-acyl-phospholipid synthase-like methyltransferase